MRLIDTHCHFDIAAFDADRETLLTQARDVGLANALLCAGDALLLETTSQVARRMTLSYALGIHPLCMPPSVEIPHHLDLLIEALEAHLEDPYLAAIGEIGIDGFVPNLDRQAQHTLFRAQLQLAQKYKLPVSVHARHAVEEVVQLLRRYPPCGGVVHAFNGSTQQAQTLLQLGMKLGFGGALMYSGSKRIRRVFAEVPETGFVLETDAPDMPSPQRREHSDPRTHLSDIAWYAKEAAQLRGLSLEALAEQSTRNALEAFPRMALLLHE